MVFAYGTTRHYALLEKGFTFKILETSALYHAFFYGDSFKFSFDLGCIVQLVVSTVPGLTYRKQF